jgi:hypothetical protein
MQWIQWTRCPQCDSIAEIVDRDVWPSTDGPVEHVSVRCVRRHRFVMPVVALATQLTPSSMAAVERDLVPARLWRPGAGAT